MRAVDVKPCECVWSIALRFCARIGRFRGNSVDIPDADSVGSVLSQSEETQAIVAEEISLTDLGSIKSYQLGQIIVLGYVLLVCKDSVPKGHKNL